MPAQLIEQAFSYHPPRPGQPERYEAIRGKAKELAYLLDELCPLSRERSVAMTHLETAVMWANAAIAREGGAPGQPDRPPGPPSPPRGPHPEVG
jgi:hypothetical protein